jgi:hypothetical protein
MRLLGKKAVAAVFSSTLIIFSLTARANNLTPDNLTPPNITSPVYEGAEIVEVRDVTPKAAIKIYVNNDYSNPIGNGSCPFGRCWLEVRKLSAGEKITATQTVGIVTSHPTRQGLEVTVDEIPIELRDKEHKYEQLVKPEIDGPLYECQGILPVKNVVEGAMVQVFEDSNTNAPIGRSKTPLNVARPRTKKLEKDWKIVANQILHYNNPSVLSSPAEPVLSEHEKKDFPTPVVNKKSLGVGDDIVEVSNLWIGAKVDIYYEDDNKREELGGGFAPWTNTRFQVKTPLKAEWVNCPHCIKADLSLCKIKTTSIGATVQDEIDQPNIVPPVCAGSFIVAVCNVAPRATLTIFKKSKNETNYTQIAQQGEFGECTDVFIGGPGGNYTFGNEDEIYATQEKGDLKKESSPVTVKDTDQAYVNVEIGNGKLCKPCSGQDYGPIFVRDTLTSKSGPVFKATMCGAEAAKVTITDPKGVVKPAITLEEIQGKKGHFEGTWDWNTMGWNKPDDILFGKYKATFTIGPGSKPDKYFYVKTQGCVDCAVIDFYQTCVDRVNKLRSLEKPPLSALQRDQGREGDADYDARVNYEKGAHAQMSGSAQNECGTRPSIQGILDQCIEQKMYYDEKPCYERYQNNDPKACYSFKSGPGCECQYGHYKNMTGTYKSLACGIYVTPEGEFKAVMNFF